MAHSQAKALCVALSIACATFASTCLAPCVARADTSTVQQAFFAATDGTVHDEFVQDGSWVDYSIPGTTPAADTKTAVIRDPATGRNVIYQGTNNLVHDVTVQNGRWIDYTIPGAAMEDGSNISVVDDPSSGRNIFFEAPDGTLHDAFVQNGAWVNYQIPNTQLEAHSAISVVEDPATGRNVFVEGTDGGLYDEFVQNGAWVTSWILNTHLAADSAISAIEDSGTGRNVFFQGTDNNLYDAWVQNGSWTFTYLTSFPMKPQTEISAVEDSGTGRNVFFERSDGSLHDAFVNNGSWSDVQIPGVALASSAGISAMEDPDQTGRNVFMQGADGHLYDDTVQNGAWTLVHLTASLGGGSSLTALSDANQPDIAATFSVGSSVTGSAALPGCNTAAPDSNCQVIYNATVLNGPPSSAQQSTIDNELSNDGSQSHASSMGSAGFTTDYRFFPKVNSCGTHCYYVQVTTCAVGGCSLWKRREISEFYADGSVAKGYPAISNSQYKLACFSSGALGLKTNFCSIRPNMGPWTNPAYASQGQHLSADDEWAIPVSGTAGSVTLGVNLHAYHAYLHEYASGSVLIHFGSGWY